MRRRIIQTICCLLAVLVLSGCGAGGLPADVGNTEAPACETQKAAENTAAPEADSTDRLLITSGKNTVIDDNTLDDISYRLSGEYENVTIEVNTDDEQTVTFVLDDFSVTNNSQPVFYIQSAGTVVFICKENTNNVFTLMNSVASEELTNAAIYSKAETKFTGEGGLSIVAPDSNGISGKSSVSVDSCNISIRSGEKGIKAETDLTVSSGAVSITSGEDAMHSDGDLVISGGKITIRSADDGIHADNSISIKDGTVIIEESHEGIESMNVIISGGEVSVVAKDDGINAVAPDSEENDKQAAAPDNFNGETPPEPPDGELPEPTGDFRPQFSNGNPPEKPNGEEPPKFDGDYKPNKNNNSSSQPGMRGGMFEDDGSVLSISGGSVYVNAKGDGVDSNGTLLISGGAIHVDGPSDNANGYLDFNGEGKISGGTIIATGSSGWAANFSSSETQASVLYVLDKTYEAGTSVSVLDSDRNIIVSITPSKDFQAVTFSAPVLQVGENYTLAVGEDKFAFTVSSNIETFGYGIRERF